MKTGARFVFSACALLALGACGDTAGERGSRVPGEDCAPSADGSVVVLDGWLRAQPNADAMTAAYFNLRNCTDKPLTITGVSTAAAGRAEIHQTSRDANGLVSMAPAGDIPVNPGETVVFEPGGLHAMLMMLTGPINPDDQTTLTVELGEEKSVTFNATAKSAADAANTGHDSH
ncbi:MAG: copper chaperone PCu(A)C [Parvularculaceae bacterium]|nr:copper chaperone PCu(A)C [Parvularculaceae bacterium]